MSILNLHIYPSPFKFESRILRETKSIIDFRLAEKVIVASGWRKGMPENEQIDQNRSVRRFKLFFDRFSKSSLISILKYFEFILRVFFFYKGKKIKVVNCHSLFVLPVGYLLKLFDAKIWLIYDAHELESEKSGLNKWGKTISSVVEKFLIKRVNKVIVVSPSIDRWYRHKYGICNVITIRNTPELLNRVGRQDVFNRKFGIPGDSMIFIYQGAVNKGRGIEKLLNIFSKFSFDKHLVIMGYGPLVEIVKEFEKKNSNIHFLDAVHPSEIFFYTEGADVGLSIIENISLSYYYCLPNKLFEYLHSGLPVLVSDFPDMSEVVNQFDCGWTTEISEKELTHTLNNISRDALLMKIKGVVNVQHEINWQKESGLLFDAFPNDLER